MYTYEEFACGYECHIFDPEGYVICVVQNKHEAEILLSHLNRGAQ